MALDDPSQVGETVFQLVQGNPKIYQYALRILNSHLMPGAEVEKIVPLIKKHLMKESMDKALKFSNLESKLVGLRRPLSSLYFLYQLAGGQQFTFIPGAPPLRHQQAEVSVIPQNFSSSSLPAVPLFSGTSGQRQSRMQDGNQSTSFLLPGQLSQMSLSGAAADSAYHSYQQQQSFAQQPLKPSINGEKKSAGLKSTATDPLQSVKRSAPFVGDAAVLNDLLFVFQGTNGEFIQWNPHKQAYVIDQKIECPLRSALERILQLPAIYHRVGAILGKLETERSLTLQALRYAVETELADYHRYMATIEKRLDSRRRQMEQPLSLQQLLVYQHQPLERMQFTLRFLEQLAELKGGRLLNRLHSLMDHGNPNLSRFALSLMEQISKPYFRIMSRWLHEGVLDDPHGEFFVSQPSSQSLSSDEQNVWQSKFQLIPTEAPAFLPSPLVDKIFRLGKSLDFIRQVCGERVFVQSRRVPRELTYAALMDNRLADAIKADYKAISRHLLQLVYEKYKLPMHLIILKQFLLLGQGDFIQNLLEILADDLDKPANALHRHRLIDSLEMALKNSSVAVQIDKTLTRHLDVLIHPPMSNDVGWDVFSLTYTLETDSFSLPGDNGQPLEMKSVVSTVLTADVRTVYLRLFRYVWWIRRLDFSLNRMWHQDTVLYRLIASSARPSTARLLSTGGSSAAAKDRLMNSELQKLVDEIGMTQTTQLMYRTRMEMAHFVHQLQFYVLFDTMNAAWLRLEQFIRSGDGDLDEFIAVHRQYLSELSAYALFNCGGAEKGAMLGMVMDLGKLVLQYSAMHAMASQISEEIVEFLSRMADQSQRRIQQGQWALTADDERLRLAECRRWRKSVDDLHAKIGSIRSGFCAGVKRFTQALDKDGDMKLKHLSNRLQFNEWC